MPVWYLWLTHVVLFTHWCVRNVGKCVSSNVVFFILKIYRLLFVWLSTEEGRWTRTKKWEEDVYFFIMHFKNKVDFSRLKSSFCNDIRQMTASGETGETKLFLFQLINTVERRDFEEIAPKTLSVWMEKPHEHEQVDSFLQAVSTFWLFSWSA